jgi:hypothetical protein
MTDTAKKPKRTLLRVLMLAFLAVALFGASATAWYTIGPGNVFRNVPRVRKGQSREEIVRLLGEPDSKRWGEAEFTEPADCYSYGDTRENWFINYVSVCFMVGIVDPPEFFYPGFTLYFDKAGRLDRVTSQSRDVVRMFKDE